jgi:SNF2-related domain
MNRLDDLFGQLQFLRAPCAASYAEWNQGIVVPLERDTQRGVKNLMSTLVPIAIRREKGELLDLPEQHHVTQRIKLSLEEDEFYVAVFQYSKVGASPLIFLSFFFLLLTHTPHPSHKQTNKQKSRKSDPF